MRRAVPAAILGSVFLLLPSAAGAEPPPGIRVSRTAERIAVDGDLSDAGWKGAARIEEFWEYRPGENVAPKVKTVALVTYDGKALYVGVACDDPEPGRIRAPFVERDQVFGDQDNLAVLLDTQGDGQVALQLRTNARGIQADAVNNDVSGAEDFSPDFFYDTAARITPEGWTAEFRIPFASLRYAAAEPRTWKLAVMRNYPRDYRYQIASSPVPRDSNCMICHFRELTGLEGLPPGGHLVAAPYVAGTWQQERDEAGELTGGPVDPDAGLDVKWTPSAGLALDGTLNPDFSQVEADAAQISVNTRFALFYPEKRPFFLESVDLFDTPITAVYTRSITDPLWGGRATGKLGATAFTLLVAQDEGGGSVILPGPQGSDAAPQDFESFVAIGRARYDFAGSSVGLVVTDREVRGGGYNRVLGPDLNWRLSGTDRVWAQVLYSGTENPDRPDLSPAWNGERSSSHALEAGWEHVGRRLRAKVEVEDYGDAFRADDGFVTQVGFRQAEADVQLASYPTGFLTEVTPFVGAEYAIDRDGNLLAQEVSPGIYVAGKWNLQAQLSLWPGKKERVGEEVLSVDYGQLVVVANPSRVFPNAGAGLVLGEQVDYAGARVGRGGTVTGSLTARPFDRLAVDLSAERQWLDVAPAPGGERQRLFTADVAWLKATFHFTSRAYLRLIGQLLDVRRDPALYASPVPARSGFASLSALFAYRVNWQTVFFLGYGDDADRTETNDLVRSRRQVFAKISYAWQR